MDRISFKQFLIIVFLLAADMKIFMLPAYMTRTSDNESFLVMVAGFVSDLILLVVVLAVIRLSDGTFFESLSQLITPVGAKIVAVVLTVFYTIKTFLLLTEFRIFFSVSVFELPLSLFHILPLILMLLYISGKHLCVLGRVSEMIFPFVVIGMVLLAAFSLPAIDFSELLPLWSGGEKFRAGTTSFPMWFGDFSLLLLFMGKTDKRKRIYFSLIAAVLAAGFLLLFSAMLYALYANVPEVLFYGFNISNMTQFSTSGFRFGRFDLLLFCLSMLGVLVILSLMTITVIRLCNFVVRRKTATASAIGVLAVLTSATFVFFDANAVSQFMTDFMPLPAVIIQYGLPLILLVMLLIKKGAARRKIARELARLEAKGGGDDKAHA